MGCASSKRVEAAVALDVYRPPPTSIALFDINTIQEPWLITTTAAAAAKDDGKDEFEKKSITPVPLPILEKLESYELAPHSWSEVSKALEDLKPSLNKPAAAAAAAANTPLPPLPTPQKVKSFHTLDELDSDKKKPGDPPKTTVSPPRPPPPELGGGPRPVKDNSFIVRDRLEQESKKGDAAAPKWKRRDPFEGLPERQPPGNADGVVLYTTTLRGVRRTFEDCEQARQVVEAHAEQAGVAVDERDVSLHGEYLKELRELAGEAASVPRLFVAGRYVGGAAEVVELGDAGRLAEMFRWVARRGGGKGGRRGCEGCGGARFVPCLECGGSCKVVGPDGKSVARCAECNENGLALCPLCH